MLVLAKVDGKKENCKNPLKFLYVQEIKIPYKNIIFHDVNAFQLSNLLKVSVQYSSFQEFLWLNFLQSRHPSLLNHKNSQLLLISIHQHLWQYSSHVITIIRTISGFIRLAMYQTII